MSALKPSVSVVIPVHNEEGLLDTATRALREAWNERVGRSWELILVENGSTDGTLDIATALARRWPDEIRVLELANADYGAALRQGLLDARAELVICEEVDLCDVDFHLRALGILDDDQADLVVGSKALPGSDDRRPWLRRAGTRTLNALLRAAVGFQGTDTHGLKALRRAALAPIIAACRSRRDLFASELVIRAERSHLRVTEVPVTLAEKRPPTTGVLRRAPRVLGGLIHLAATVRRRD